MSSNHERIVDYLAFVDEYRARDDDTRLGQLIMHFMGKLFLTDTWWFNTPLDKLTKIIAIGNEYPESIAAFFHDLARRDQYGDSFAVPSQWLAVWDLCGQRPEPVVRILTALCNFEPGKRLSDLPAAEWWSEWDAALAPFDPAQMRDLCEQLWTIPLLSESVGGYYASDLAKKIGRAAIWGIAAVADRHTVDLLAAIPHQIKEPTFVPAMAILSLGQIHSLGRVRDADIPARLRQLSQGVKSKISQRVIDATLARIATP